MSSVSAVDRVLKENTHSIDGLRVTIEQYNGMKEHGKVFTRGRYTLGLKKMKKSSTFELTRMLENVFQNCGGYSMIEFSTGKRDVPAGDTLVHFYTHEARERAIAVVENELRDLNLIAYRKKPRRS